MSDAPFYRFCRSPRFSANHLAEYLCTTDAGQREAVIRKAKFPRKITTVAYQQIVPALRSFLASNKGDLGVFDDPIQRLKAKASREDAYARDEALRCIAAIEAFKIAYRKAKLGKATFLTGPQDLTMRIGGLTVNVRLDPPMVESGNDDQTFCGGCVLFLANSPESRKNIEDRRRYVAALIHYVLEHTTSNLEPLARLCVSFDAFGGEVVKAPASNERLRKRIAAACREAVDCWDRIDPPPGYDGPDWRPPISP